MPHNNNEIIPNSGFKADNFDKEKEAADKIEEQNKTKNDNAGKAKEQEVIQEQKETD